MKLPPECGVVFDCNILLQAAARKSGPAAACLRLAEKDFVRLYLSEEILTEISEVLTRPQVRAQFPELTDDIVGAFIDRLKHTAHTVGRIIPRKFIYQRDVDDECYINLAIEAKADYLISRDRDLLDLMTGHTDVCKDFRRRFRGLKVVTPIEFLKDMEKAASEGDAG